MPSETRTDLHTQLIEARSAHQKAEYRLAVLLWELKSRHLYLERGCSSVTQYGEVLLGLSPRQTRALVAIGRAMRNLPALAATFAEGRLDHTKAREIARIATPATEAAWIDRALNATSRDLERLVAGSRAGEPPPSGPTPFGPARVRLTFEMQSSDAEILLRALAVLRQRAGIRAADDGGRSGDDDLDPPDGDADDGVLLAGMARLVLTEPIRSAADPTPPERYRVLLTRCVDCQATHVGHFEAGEVVQAEAACDAEVLDLTVPGRPLSHAVPPATRRRVMALAGGRCAVPHCRAHLWIDLHHIQPRQTGGTHDEANLIALCPTHHRLLHDERLVLTRDRQGCVVFRHPDGQPFGVTRLSEPPTPTRDPDEARVMALLGPRPQTPVELARALGRTPTAVLELLRDLRRRGWLVELPTACWARVDQIARPAPHVGLTAAV